MKKYTVLAVLNIAIGTLVGLTAAQAKDRAYGIKRSESDAGLPKGVLPYEATTALQFKVGETVYVDGELNKALAEQLESEEGGKSRSQKAKAEKADKAAAEHLDELRRKAQALDDLQPELAVLRDKASQWDEFETKGRPEWEAFQEQATTLRSKAALWDALPEEVRKAAEEKKG